MVQAQAAALTRRRAALAVAALAAVALALRWAQLGYGLPFVFHSDFFQIEQAASLVRRGWFTDSYNYPHGLVYVYAAAGWLMWALGGAGDWAAFTERFADPASHHLVGRAVSAAAGALLVPGVYRLARVGCTRGVALLAAAAIALDPAQLLTAIQSRPHAPVVALLVLVAPTALRLVERPAGAARRALRAGAGFGLCASVFHLGWIGALWAAALVASCRRSPSHPPNRPRHRAALDLALLALAFAAVWGGLNLLMSRPELARPLPGRDALAPQTLLGTVANLREWADLARLPSTALNWLASSPTLFAGAALFALGCLSRRRGSRERRMLWLYASFPLLVFVVMATFVGPPARYAQAATPFLAVLAAAACTRPWPPAPWRALAGALLLLYPLAGTAVCLVLLGRVDTRLSVAALLPALDAIGARVALQDRLLVDRSALPAGTSEFPPYGTVETSARAADAPRLALRDLHADLYLRATGSQWSRGPLAPIDLEHLGFRLYGVLRGGPASSTHLPDLPDRLCVQWLDARRPGPSIEFWATDAGARALQPLLPPEQVESWTGPDTPEAAVAAVLAQRATRATGGSAGLPPPLIVRLDLDGDGLAEDVSSNVGAAQLLPLLALPGDAWSDAGGARGGSGGAPRLAGRGRPVNGQPVLLLLSGAPPDAEVRWSVRVRFGDGERAAAELPMPAMSSGPSGWVALAAPWPKDAPAGTTITSQALVADDGAPQGVAASNTVQATSAR